MQKYFHILIQDNSEELPLPHQNLAHPTEPHPLLDLQRWFSPTKLLASAFQVQMQYGPYRYQPARKITEIYYTVM